jgi:GNAT superfamily N-acetyltransferase
MTVKNTIDSLINGDTHEVSTDTAGILPGTTFPAKPTSGEPDKHHHQISTQSQPGPLVHSKATTVTLYAPRDLKDTGLIPQMHDLINNAFGTTHSTSGIFPAASRRLSSPDQLVAELSGAGIFTYVITYTGTGTQTVIGTASAKRYKDTFTLKPASEEVPLSVFMRSGVFGPHSEGWELSLMAVDSSLQRQGLAGLLMSLVEGEVKRRFVLDRAARGLPDLKLVMLLTTVKEINWDFYVRRGYQLDYETYHEPGFLRSSTGFHVVHMSKLVEC